MSARFAAVGALRLREFEDGVVVFHPQSWDAHLLNPAAAAVLEMCMSGPVTQQEVEAFLCDVLSDDDRQSAADHSTRLLTELTELGLLRVDVANATQ